MARRDASWLLGELPTLVEEGVLSQAAADRLRARYADKADDRQGWALNVFAVLGSVLVGGGLILVLAHNWDGFSRPLRVALSLGPLAAAQALALWLVVGERRSPGWREGVGAFWTLAIGASIALVAQTYHFPADLPRFLLTWTLLTLPVVYGLGASLAALLYLGGAVWWAALTDGSGLWLWLLLALAVPHLVWLARRQRPSHWETVVAWGIAVTATSAVLVTTFDAVDFASLWVPALSAGFGVLYGLRSIESWAAAGGVATSGVAPRSTGRPRWQKALGRAGLVGSVGLGVMLAFEGPWRSVRRLFERLSESDQLLWVATLMIVVLLAAAGTLYGRGFAAAGTAGRLIGALPFVALIAWLATGLADEPYLGELVLNAWVFALGLVLTLGGVRESARGRANWGLALLSVLILVRFFDGSMSFVARGLGFMAVGIAFLALNFVLARRMRGES